MTAPDSEPGVAANGEEPQAAQGGEEPQAAQGDAEPQAAQGGSESLIRVEGVHKSFGDLEVLRGIDLAVAKGESMVVIGGSGTGKSVLIKHIIGLLRPDEGTVTVDGRVVAELKRLNLGELRRGMGMLFQYAALFDSMTVGDNVAFALRRHTRMNAALAEPYYSNPSLAARGESPALHRDR